jgi:hypothetical protein
VPQIETKRRAPAVKPDERREMIVRAVLRPDSAVELIAGSPLDQLPTWWLPPGTGGSSNSCTVLVVTAR